MAANLSEVVDTVRHLSPAEQREVLARLWPEQALAQANTVWTSVRFGDHLRVVAYGQNKSHMSMDSASLLQRGALARRENEADGTYEIYGPDRTFYVTMTSAREFVALLSSWLPDHPPREVELQDT